MHQFWHEYSSASTFCKKPASHFIFSKWPPFLKMTANYIETNQIRQCFSKRVQLSMYQYLHNCVVLFLPYYKYGLVELFPSCKIVFLPVKLLFCHTYMLFLLSRCPGIRSSSQRKLHTHTGKRQVIHKPRRIRLTRFHPCAMFRHSARMPRTSHQRG